MTVPFDWRSLSSTELEAQFNPRVTVPDYASYLDRAAQASDRARTALPLLRDFRYGPDPRQLIDIFPIANAAAVPAVIYVHGGFWRALSKEQTSGVALPLHDAGIATVLVGYDLCPNVSLDRVVEQVAESLRWCMANLERYGIDRNRLHVAGSSAGAHLLAMALMTDPSLADGFRSAWLASGVYELESVLSISVNADIRLNADSARRNSPLLHCRPLSTRVIVAVGGLESPAWIDQSRRFATVCSTSGIDAQFRSVPDAHHFSIGLGTAGAPLNRDLIEFVSEPLSAS